MASRVNDNYVRFELSRAAVCYIVQAQHVGQYVRQDREPRDWPLTWDPKWWKPEPCSAEPAPLIKVKDAIYMLKVARELIAEEIYRLQRMEDKDAK